ncbi:MAG: ankyrin repeat domain-containing protein [Sphingomonadaceae bacterium]|nr:ankyrin repeat domain-containing protein [Sphingomonadaceae bacterium]
MANWKGWTAALGLVAALGGGVAAPQPAAAQGTGGSFSASHKFLKAVKERNFADMTAALSSGPTIINATDQDTGEGALHIVTRERDSAWMRYLLTAGADPNVRDAKGTTPLMLAAEQRFVDGARLLLASGAKVDATNRTGETPLIRAVQLKDAQMVRFLIENGADPERQDNLAGYSARDYAERDGRSGVIASILRNARKPSAPAATGAGLTPVPAAAAAGPK